MIGLFRLIELSQAKIENLYDAFIAYNDVARLHIAVNDAGCVSGRQPICDLHGMIQCLAGSQSFTADQFIESLSLDILHGDKVNSIRLVDVVNVDNMSDG